MVFPFLYSFLCPWFCWSLMAFLFLTHASPRWIRLSGTKVIISSIDSHIAVFFLTTMTFSPYNCGSYHHVALSRHQLLWLYSNNCYVIAVSIAFLRQKPDLPDKVRDYDETDRQHGLGMTDSDDCWPSFRCSARPLIITIVIYAKFSMCSMIKQQRANLPVP